MMTPVAFAASLLEPLPGSTATATREGIEQSSRQAHPSRDQQAASFQPGQQQSPAEDITATPSQANSDSSYRASTTTSTQLSHRVDRGRPQSVDVPTGDSAPGSANSTVEHPTSKGAPRTRTLRSPIALSVFTREI